MRISKASSEAFVVFGVCIEDAVSMQSYPKLLTACPQVKHQYPQAYPVTNLMKLGTIVF
jgi:hypothetical protein